MAPPPERLSSLVRVPPKATAHDWRPTTIIRKSEMIVVAILIG
jgi:hypothetical protein